MPGTPTPFYGFPIPAYIDAADAPHDIGALAQKIEDTLKNGFTMPTGSLTVGDKTLGGYYPIRAGRLVGGVQLATETGITSWAGDGALIMVQEGGVSKFAYVFDKLGGINVISVAANGIDPETYRPVPFATYTTVRSLTISNTANASLVVNYPTGRFTQPPAVFVQPWHSSGSYFGYVTANSATSATCGARHNDNTLTTATMTLQILAVQGTPTGLEA